MPLPGAGAARAPPPTARAVAEWARLDPDEHAFLRSAADRLRDHDDRAEFLAGLDLVLAGITTQLVPPA
jgi:hypothetical protein